MKIYKVRYLKDNNLEQEYFIASSVNEAKGQFLAKNKLDTNQIVSISELYGNNNKSINFNFVVNTLKKIKKQIEGFLKKLTYKHYIAIGLLILAITGWNIYKSNESNSYNYSQDYEKEDKEFRQAEIEASKKLNSVSNNYKTNINKKQKIERNNEENNINPHLKEEVSNTINLKTIIYKLKTIKAKKCLNEDSECLEVQLKYPIDIIGNKSVVNIIKKHKNKKIPYFNPNNIDSYYSVMGLKRSNEPLPPSGYEYIISTKPISETNKIICMEDTDGGYTGGAHYNYGTYYTCYNKISGRVLKLNDVLNIDSYENKENLNRVAEKYFRIKNNITVYTPLTSIGLFKNKFKLAKNYYFTNSGIVFYYNPYDIAPYGATGGYKAEFIIPYTDIASIINPNAELSEYISIKSNTNNKSNYNTPQKTYNNYNYPIYSNKQDAITISNGNMYIELFYKVMGNKIKFEITAQNQSWYDVKGGGVSISFPTLANTYISKIKRGSFSSLKVYPKGSKIWNRRFKSLMNSQYLLVEAWSNRWKSSHTKRASFVMDITNLKHLKVQLRGVLLKRKKELLTPSTRVSIKDQQDYPVKVFGIDLAKIDNISTNSKNNYQINKYNNNFIDVYYAKISQKDKYSSSGKRLKKVSAILQQDRANYHKFYKRDKEDTSDIFFTTKENRDKLKYMLKYISPAMEYDILNSYPLVKVAIYKDHIEVSNITKITSKKDDDRVYINLHNYPYVCYKQKVSKVMYGKNRYIYLGCYTSKTPCSHRNDKHFGKYPNDYESFKAARRCSRSTPKFVD